MLPLSGALPLPYVLARVTLGALVAHRHSFAPPLCRTSHYRRTFVPLWVSLWNDLSDPVFDGVRIHGRFYEQNHCFPVGLICSFFLSPTIFFLSSVDGLAVWCWGLQIDSVLTRSRPCTADWILIIIIIIIIIIVIVIIIFVSIASFYTFLATICGSV